MAVVVKTALAVDEGSSCGQAETVMVSVAKCVAVSGIETCTAKSACAPAATVTLTGTATDHRFPAWDKTNTAVVLLLF